MGYVVVGVALLLWGILVGRAGRKLGVVLSLIPVAVWFGFLAWFEWTGTLDGPAGDVLPAYLVIGLLAFLAGSNLVGWTVTSRKTRRKP